MENSFQTSFIPKKSLSSPERAKEKTPMGIFSFLSIVIFIGVCLWIGGLYLYKSYLTKQKSDLSQSLGLSRNSFEPNTISELELFNKKVNASRSLLSNHFLISPLFEQISAITVPSIQFTKFNYQSTDKDFQVQMSGLARDYTSIALQDKEFNTNKGRYFKDVVFSDLVLSSDVASKGYVSFNVSFSVDRALLSYENNLILQNKSTSSLPTSSTINQ
jgi:hypothetical protein